MMIAYGFLILFGGFGLGVAATILVLRQLSKSRPSEWLSL